ncbi:MAG: D-glycero-beta-D-manno-heptose 1-phosphate adenylyltransferase, partial [Candidatus Omnitrophica bacterium]|nr:D-glycero-beta-D-manno-heptose 1-phosphate adenylyltransferase [Candidatus Omnitrophota bacterium]
MIEKKIKNLKSLKKLIALYKKKKRKIVFTNGCFDILHYGHVKYLEEAKKKGDVLVVGVNSDSSVRKIKGKRRPLVNEKDRLRIVAALESVDYVTLFKETTPLNLIKGIKPDILIKGADWDRAHIVGAEFVEAYGGEVLTVPLVKNRSTSKLIKEIAKR